MIPVKCSSWSENSFTSQWSSVLPWYQDTVTAGGSIYTEKEIISSITGRQQVRNYFLPT